MPLINYFYDDLPSNCIHQHYFHFFCLVSSIDEETGSLLSSEIVSKKKRKEKHKEGCFPSKTHNKEEDLVIFLQRVYLVHPSKHIDRFDSLACLSQPVPQMYSMSFYTPPLPKSFSFKLLCYVIYFFLRYVLYIFWHLFFPISSCGQTHNSETFFCIAWKSFAQKMRKKYEIYICFVCKDDILLYYIQVYSKRGNGNGRSVFVVRLEHTHTTGYRLN